MPEELGPDDTGRLGWEEELGSLDFAWPLFGRGRFAGAELVGSVGELAGFFPELADFPPEFTDFPPELTVVFAGLEGSGLPPLKLGLNISSSSLK